jgi:murein DD-endopeptidase MepM/ murein hydrolase activator NlpD
MELTPPARTCGRCGGAIVPGTPHVRVTPSGVKLFCSSACLDTPTRDAALPPLPRRRFPVKAVPLFALGLGIASLSPCSGRIENLGLAALPAARPLPVSRPSVIGPTAPDEEALAVDFLAELGQDRWLHPLPGPTRRMPARESRVFGAARDGHRPDECEGGHCGVDLGGEIWGEAIFAVHDGVVEKANRDPSRSGGNYVRLSHRDGRVFTQYFHLAAIPRHIREGATVSAGDVIGLLGDTGVDHSTAHLHFTISVRPEGAHNEIFMDPEPLVALWPLKVVTVGSMVASWGPGAPLGAAGRFARRAKPKKRRAETEKVAAPSPPAPAASAIDVTEPDPVSAAMP